MASQQAPGPHSSLGEVFRVFLRLGLTSFGGPIAHLGYFRDGIRRAPPMARREDLRRSRRAVAIPARSGEQPGRHRDRPFSRRLRRARFDRLGGLHLAVGPRAGAVRLWRRTLGGALGSGWLHGLKVVAVAVVAQAVLGMMRSLAPDRERATLAVAAAVDRAGFPDGVGPDRRDRARLAPIGVTFFDINAPARSRRRCR